MAVCAICGCANKLELIAKASHAIRNDVFAETANSDAQPDKAIADIKLTIALPVDEVIVEREVELHAGANMITVTPLYKKRSLRPHRGKNFIAGVKTLEISVD